ncbi:uncharacterized protein LOC133893382 [Phragmites australis]|uniref:uncharacterized protein LOC133893382 n=1 Tax=Phragmites australis TaxID=29695 RepID=UPI002D779E8C|nr:uncharacterized protein LOC133893382 [Phragmites australis]
MLPWRRLIGQFIAEYYIPESNNLQALQICINVHDRPSSWQAAVFASRGFSETSLLHRSRSPDRASMASLLHQASMPATAMVYECDEEFVPQGFTCFGRSLSRASSSSSRLEYGSLGDQGEGKRAAQSARAKLRWKAAAQEIMAKGGGGTGARRRKQQAAAFSYDSRSYALNFDHGPAE